MNTVILCKPTPVNHLSEVTRGLDGIRRVDAHYAHFKKTFDAVNHRLILINLESFGIRGRSEDIVSEDRG